MQSMKIRDSYNHREGNEELIEIASGELEIMGDDNRSLFSIRLSDDGSIEVSANMMTKFNGTLLDNTPIMVIPKGSNQVIIKRPEYEQ